MSFKNLNLLLCFICYNIHTYLTKKSFVSNLGNFLEAGVEMFLFEVLWDEAMDALNPVFTERSNHEWTDGLFNEIVISGGDIRTKDKL